MIVVSPNVVLNAAQDDGTDANSPFVGWRNIVTIDNVTADSADADFPITNVANPSTSELWKAAAIGDVSIVVAPDDEADIDYVAIARHNFGTIGAPVTIGGRDETGDSYTTLAEAVLPDDAPAIFRIAAASYYDIEIKVGEGSAIPQAAVIYVGKSLLYQRHIYVGHTPITYGREPNIIQNHAEDGSFLGQIQVGGRAASAVQIQNMTPAWYRENLDPFFLARPPFFFAWRPGTYPREVGYAAITGNPMPANQRPNGMMEASFNMVGRVT